MKVWHITPDVGYGGNLLYNLTNVPMIANSREDPPEKRTFHEKFTLKSREYKYGDKYYLVLADANDEKNILQQYEFMIDIVFVDDFGF